MVKYFGGKEKIIMKEIKEIKSIEITFEKDNIFRMSFNGYEDKAGYNLIISKNNALSVARTLTRIANMFWQKFDKIAIEEIEKKE